MEIINNSTSEVDGYGGGIAVEESSNPELTNVVIAGNTAYYGGACNFYLSANAILTNVTISNNSAQLHGGISSYDSSPSLINCILWDNADQEIFDSPNVGSVTATYSNIQGGYDGEGNFDQDPQFCNPPVGNYQLAENSSSLNSGLDGSHIGYNGDPGCAEPYMTVSYTHLTLPTTPYV